MKPNNNQTVTPASVTPSVAELQKLTPVQAAVDFVKQTTSAVRAFIVAAKLLIVLEPTLKPGQTLGSVILKLANVSNGLRRRVKSTIDNGRQAVRVWKELVDTGHITEAQFDGFTFGDFVALNRVMSGASRQKLTGADVALLIESSPNNWHEELDCLFTYGQCLDDRAEAEKKTAAKKSSTGVSPVGTAGVSPAESESQPDGTSAVADDAQGEDAGTSPDSPKATPSDEPAVAGAPSSEPAEGKIIHMPSPSQKATAEDAFKLIAALETLISGMTATEVAKVAPAIAELNATVQDSLKPAKKAAPKRKAAKAKAA